MVLYTRHPATNFIFDEQEALLANPYVRAAADPTTKIGWLEAFRRDFWGLTPERTIGSYRPLPDLVWRAMWKIGGARRRAPSRTTTSTCCSTASTARSSCCSSSSGRATG